MVRSPPLLLVTLTRTSLGVGVKNGYFTVRLTVGVYPPPIPLTVSLTIKYPSFMPSLKVSGKTYFCYRFNFSLTGATQGRGEKIGCAKDFDKGRLAE